MRSSNSSELVQVAQERNGLQCFPKALEKNSLKKNACNCIASQVEIKHKTKSTVRSFIHVVILPNIS